MLLQNYIQIQKRTIHCPLRRSGKQHNFDTYSPVANPNIASRRRPVGFVFVRHAFISNRTSAGRLLAHPIKSLTDRANLNKWLRLRFTKIGKWSVIGERKCRLCLADVRGEKWMHDKQKQTPQDICGEANPNPEVRCRARTSIQILRYNVRGDPLWKIFFQMRGPCMGSCSFPRLFADTLSIYQKSSVLHCKIQCKLRYLNLFL